MEAFYDLRHQTIYGAMLDMFDAREAVDVITLQAHLKKKMMLDEVGGIAYLSALPDIVPSSAHLGYYLTILKEKYTLRKTIDTATKMLSQAYEFQGDINHFVDGIERDVMKISNSRVQTGTPPIKELVKQALTQIESDWQRKGAITGLETGFKDLDRATDGMHAGDMIVIAARPSMGKTSLAMNIVEHVACDLKIPCGVFSLEMKAEQLVRRMLYTRARINSRDVRDGIITEAEFPKMFAAAGKISDAPIYCDDSSSLSIMQLRARARRMAQQYGIKLFVIDYLQLLNADSSGKRHENRQQEVTSISSGVKGLAKDLNCPVIVLSQLNREMERDKERKPRLADLRESGAIEQDADLVGMLYKPPQQNQGFSENKYQAYPVNLLIAKQRNGDSGMDILFTFLKSITRFQSCCPIDP